MPFFQRELGSFFLNVWVLDMPRSYLAMQLLFAAIMMVTTGCRQTTGTTAGGPLVPLSPNNAATTPALVPFGGPTRVTPPPTGSYTVPNNYMGGSAPISQLPPTAVGGFAAAGGNPVIGSGVQRAGWTETGSNFQGPGNSVVTYGVNPSSNLRSGGMQVIDLTGAPSPPGYRAPVAPPANFGTPQNFPSQPGFGAQQNQWNGPASVVPIQSVPAPSRGNLAGAGVAGPSTEVARSREFPPSSSGNLAPINSAAPSNNGQNLNWRRPGTQF